MKTKSVVYQSLFNPEEIVKATNKIMKSSNCKCKHPHNGPNGTCIYRRCRHSMHVHRYL